MGASFAIHCLFSEIEKSFKINNYQKLEKIYVQMDGASDNCAKATYAACEHVVLKAYTEQLVFCRLPVGHTHEDIDSRLV